MQITEIDAGYYKVLMNLTLRQKVNGAILVTFILVAVLFAAIQLPFHRHRTQSAIDDVQTLLQTLVERDTEQLANEIFDERVNAIKMRIEEMRNVDGIIGISVFDQAGKLLVSSGTPVSIDKIRPEEIDEIRQHSQIKLLRWEKHGSLLYSKEVSFLGEDLGFIRIHYSLERLEKDQRNSYLIIGSTLLATLVVMLVSLNLILSKTILHPIAKLKDASHQIVHGNYETEIHSERKDEIGSLAASFEAMRVAVKKKIYDLQIARDSLSKSEERLRIITDNMVDVISQTDSHINIVYSSPSIERVFGYKPDEIVGKPAAELVHPDDVERVLKTAEDAREKQTKSVMLQFRWRAADGTYKWMESATRLLYDEKGRSKGAIFGSRDINDRMQIEEERKKLEKQLLQSQKLESIGFLAGGIAHDMNNQLSPIIGFSEIILDNDAIPATVKGNIEHIYKAGLGARDLVRQLLAFSRKQTLEYKPLDINETLNGFEPLIRRTIPEDIEIEIFPSPDIKPIMADIGQIEQVILNLSINAADAMRNGGRLTIETELVEMGDEYVTRNMEVEKGTYVTLSVSDTGCGIDEETQQRIFDPFFTTKGQKGTGLGLSSVYGIIKQHGGNIRVYSEPDKGTTFKLYLPVDDSVKITQTAPRGIEKNLHGNETILLVEDNQQVLTIAKAILDRQGYRVFAAENGYDALSILEKQNGPFSLLLTDVVLPDMNGREVYEKVFRIDPNIKVLYMSGYTDNVIVHRGVLDEGVNFIQKPFSFKILSEKVREVLDSHR